MSEKSCCNRLESYSCKSQCHSFGNSFWIDAETFQNLGGWVIDQQSIYNEHGFAYLMAHGLGQPVADATTPIQILESGRWQIWVRTRDWTAVWGRGSPAGTFQVRVGDNILPTILGTNDADWSWQKAGEIDLSAKDYQLALVDCSGFNGRCDALFFTKDNITPPNNPSELTDFRKQYSNNTVTDDPTEYDLIVAGGGFAGTCTALTASRLGLRVLLLHDRSMLGGCNSSEIRVWLGGLLSADPYPKLGNTVREISPITGRPGMHKEARLFEDDRKELAFTHPSKYPPQLRFYHAVTAVQTAPDAPKKIAKVIARNLRTGELVRYSGKYFADCTGDAWLARWMQSECLYGRESRELSSTDSATNSTTNNSSAKSWAFNESLAPEQADNQVMGHSVLWDSHVADHPVSFPDIDWGIQFNDKTVVRQLGSDWNWETGQYRDQASDIEYIRDYGLMTLFANWSFLKNHASDKDNYANRVLDWASPIGGKRESYRVVGDYILTQNDIINRVNHPDATASMTWNIDLHFPDPVNERIFSEPFRSCAYHKGIEAPYPVPYRCLYARDVDNLFLGGRCISTSHVAFALVRVMRTLGSLGEVIGMAAAVATEENVLPREVGQKHFAKLRALMEKGVDSPIAHGYKTNKQQSSYHFYDYGHITTNQAPENVSAEVKNLIQMLKDSPHPPAKILPDVGASPEW